MKWAVLLFFLPSLAFATIRNSNGTTTDTNTQITACANGDTVLLPASGTFTWTTPDVTLPNTKYITLDLNGSTITLAGTSVALNPGTVGLTRITNGTFKITGSTSGTIDVADTPTSYCYRIDHLTIQDLGGNLSSLLNVLGKGAGLVDHVTFTQLVAAREFIHVNGWGAVDDTGWTTDAGSTLAGSSNLTYFENNTFTAKTGNSNVAWVESYYGARVCFRYNVFDNVSIDMHGTPGNIGARWFEIYNNTWQNTDTSVSMNWSCSFRAGSGVIYNNTSTVTGAGNSADIGLCEEDSGYPALWQIGRGLATTTPIITGSDLALDPTYVTGNTGGITLELNQCDAPEQPNMVQLNRDVYASQRPGYSAYTYPHPFDTGGTSTTSALTGTVKLLGTTALK